MRWIRCAIAVAGVGVASCSEPTPEALDAEGALVAVVDEPLVSEPMPDETAVGAAAANIERRNRLGAETSPYLRQHQHNPVHWFPWGAEAFDAARALDRPIFLSVGYSTCYWCHVMERESFESESIAAYLNEHFVCIKVDREERPDVDDIYMTAVQLMTGRGGWPMTVFLEPDGLQPFLGGTYFPPEDRSGMPGFPTLLASVHDYWTNQRPAIMAQADEVARLVTEQLSRLAPPTPLGAGQVEIGLTNLMAGYDPTHGGFGSERKFPMPANLDFLIAVGWDRPTEQAAARYTLDRMATGGHLRPGRRRLPSVCGGREVARAALREDALRQRARGRTTCGRRPR